MTLMLSTFIQIILFTLGSALLIYSGIQDKKTRNPYLLIPALMAIGLSAGLITFLIVTIACVIIYLLPKKVNKILGKADILLLMAILIITIIHENTIVAILMYVSLALMILLLIMVKKTSQQVPLIYYYSITHAITILITTIMTIGILIGRM